MNISTIIVSRYEAERKLEQYKSITDKRRLAEDAKLQSLYACVAKGARVLNLVQAFKQTQLNERGEPKLAIARADWKTVNFFPRASFERWGESKSGAGGFSDRRQWNSHAKTRNIVLPQNTFADVELTRSRLVSAVPHIPPDVRPKFALHNYHILFEVKKWETYPVDPFLMRRIAGMLFVVEAEWELTEIEASLLSSIT